MAPPTNTQSRVGGRVGEGGRRERSEGVRRGGEKGGEGSGESTTEEVDAAPNESSTTTDTLPEAYEPVDFIECGPSIPRAYSTSALPMNGHHKPGIVQRAIASSCIQVNITV